MAANWTWVLADAYGNEIAELWRATGRTLTFKRNYYAEASCVLHHEDPEAALLLTALDSGIPKLHAYRNGTFRFGGYLAPFTEALSEDATLSLTFRSPFARLVGDGTARGRFTGPATAAASQFSQVDAGLIAKGLIDSANASGDTGLATTGDIEATKLRDRTYDYSNVGQAIVNLSNVLEGFDFGEDFILAGTTLAQFRVYASQGVVRPLAQFQYGPDTLNNVSAVSRTTDAPVNFVRIIGANGLISEVADAGSIARYGLWTWQESQSDVSVQATLDDKAAALLRPNPVRVVTFTPDPALAPSPWDDYWLGDTVNFFGRRAAFTENVNVRVNSITVTIDDNGDEVAEIPDPLTPDEEASIHAELSVEVQST